MFDEFGFPGDADLDDAAPTLHTFVYCSRAAEGVDDAEVGRIVESAKRRNLARGITGVLVFGSGVFFQWIEGPAAPMQNLIASLHRDPRHHDVVSLDQSEEKRDRLYPNWEMERVEADDIRAVLQDALGSAEDESNVAALKRILEHLVSGPLNEFPRAELIKLATGSFEPIRDDRIVDRARPAPARTGRVSLIDDGAAF